MRFRLFPVRSPLLRESRLLSFPRGTEMFHFPRFPARPKPCCQGSSPWRVAPFGHPRINACLRLPGAYRCWPRPSSARRRLGIHRWPYLAWPQRCFLPCAVVKVLEMALRPSGSGDPENGTAHVERGQRLLRKEVIQPHLPIRLPCYDFTPIIGPTFDGSLLAVRPPASGLPDFRGVTGGVYKARERIHRGMLTRDY